MTDFTKRDSGLVVPVDKPDKPARQYGALEIRDEAQRTKAKEAMAILWRAMDLHQQGSQIKLPNDLCLADRERLWRYLGQTLLGDECPECEVWT